MFTIVWAAVLPLCPNETPSATPAVTRGALNEVPEIVAHKPPGQVVITSSPGAMTATSWPKFENDVIMSLRSVEPTPMTLECVAG